MKIIAIEILFSYSSAKISPREILKLRGQAHPQNLIPAKIYPIKVYHGFQKSDENRVNIGILKEIA